MPSPGSAHAFTITSLMAMLYPILAKLGGSLANAPLDVFFGGAKPAQLDIIVILPGGRAHIVSRGIEGPPDLVIEVLFPVP